MDKDSRFSSVSMSTGMDACRHLSLLIAQPGWSDSDLKTISDCLVSSAFLDQLDQSLCREQASSIYYSNALITGEPWAQDAQDAQDENPSSRKWRFQLIRFIPRGWIYQNMANGAEHYEETILRHYDRRSRRIIDPEFANTALPLKALPWPYRFLVEGEFPAKLEVVQQSCHRTGQLGSLQRSLCLGASPARTRRASRKA